MAKKNLLKVAANFSQDSTNLIPTYDLLKAIDQVYWQDLIMGLHLQNF